MRKFSEIEKKVINKILDLHSKCQTNCAYNVFFDLDGIDSTPSLYGHSPGFDLRFDGNKYALYLDTNKYALNDFHKIFFGLITQFYEFILLMDYLVENKYVALAKYTQNASVYNDGYIVTDFLSDDLQDKITEYFSCYYYPTNKLYDMVQHNFLDLEGQEKYIEYRKQKKQYCVTTTIAFISLAISLVTNLVPIIDKKINGEQKQKVEIFISDENISKLPVIIDNKDSFIVDFKDVLHVEEDNPKKIPLDVNINITYPEEKNKS